MPGRPAEDCLDITSSRRVSKKITSGIYGFSRKAPNLNHLPHLKFSHNLFLTYFLGEREEAGPSPVEGWGRGPGRCLSCLLVQDAWPGNHAVAPVRASAPIVRRP